MAKRAARRATAAVNPESAGTYRATNVTANASSDVNNTAERSPDEID
jgi:hypothetical protein